MAWCCPSVQPAPDHERAIFRRRWAKDNEALVFYVGRIVHEKGIQVLIEAARAIVDRHPGTRFVIAGTGPKLDELRRYAVEHGVSAYMHFTGFISDQERD